MRSTLSIRSRVTRDLTVEVSLDEIELPQPGANQIIVRVEAAAVNPSDFRLMFAGADLESAQSMINNGRPVLTAPLSEQAAALASARIDQPLAVGNEGAGTVIAAGSAPQAQALLGRVVGVFGGGMYSQLRCIDADACLLFPEGTAPIAAASWFVNPMTASTMLETMRDEGHTALVQTAAASSIGQILVRLCRADDVPLVNIVRRPGQIEELSALGAEHVIDSSSTDFIGQLNEAVAKTGATLAFDAVSGGPLASQILAAMEHALTAGKPFSSYGSPVHKQLYLSGLLNRAPAELAWDQYGTAWSVGGWFVGAQVQRIGRKRAAALKARIAAEINTTFQTTYAVQLSLADALTPEAARSYSRANTNNKHVITPDA
jgi:NADPH:quinone reductase